MTSHYVSQENDPGYVLHELQGAVAKIHKFAAVRFYGDHEALAAAAIECTSLGRSLTALAEEVIELRAARESAE